jgi:hypothetical protein
MRPRIYAGCCILCLTMPLLSRGTRAACPEHLAANLLYQQSVIVAPPYQRTWYDALLRQFNPDNIEWGHRLEQRRKAFLNETANNPYFKYSLVTTTLLILLTIALAKLEVDKSRIKWLAQERHEDLLAHDLYSRRVANDAIRKYNDHMEKCNRVVEAETAGHPLIASEDSTAEGAITLDRALAENAQLKRERDQIKSELNGTKTMVSSLTTRINSIMRGGNDSAQGQGPQDGAVKQLNELREQLYRERERNKQLKGV